MFEDALEYPKRGEETVELVAIGGVLSLLGLFFVPILFLNGYFVRVIRQVTAGETAAPPAFDDWGELFTDGLVTLVIGAVYIGIPATVLIVSWFALFIPFAGASVGGEAGGALALLGFGAVLLLGLVGFVMGVIAYYLLPAAVAAYAVTGEIGAAFSPSTLRTVGGDKQYLIGLLIAIAINFLAQLVGNALIITFVGILLIPFITFYGNVASAYAIATGVADTPLVTDRGDSESTVGHSPY